MKYPLTNTIIGAIAGDIIGSPYEGYPIKRVDFDLFSGGPDFTDDTVLTVAVADCIINKKDFVTTLQAYGNKYWNRGYGGSFRRWLQLDRPRPYNSWGNGSAMRVSPVGFAYDNIKKVQEVAEQTAAITHNHPEGIKGAQAIALAIFLAKTGMPKPELKEYIGKTFHYHLDFTLDGIRPTYQFDVSCQGSVPQAIVAFLESEGYESAIRLAISIGGDSDTIACMTGGIAAAYYKKIPKAIQDFVYSKIPAEFTEIISAFEELVY